jgi:enoyl-CoA hydratase/carnithine racemase
LTVAKRLRIDKDTRGCVTFWLDRADKRNALDEQFLNEFHEASLQASCDPSVRVVALRSTSSVFCAGADLNDWANITPSNAQRLSLLGNRTFQAIADMPVPVIAAIEGAALGGGLELALACDIRIGTPDCSIGLPEPRLGNSPAWGGMARLVEAVGKAYARNMLLTGDTISGSEAFRVGILQRMPSRENFQQGFDALIVSVLACDSNTLTYIKNLFGQPSQITAAQEAVVAGFTATRPESRDRKEAFLASRSRKTK